MINNRLLKIASNTKFYGLKNNYTYKSNLKNSTCGDKISIEITLKKNTIHELRYETESCIFCQASASLLSKVVSKIDTSVWKSEIKEFQQSKKFDNTIMRKKMPILKKLFVTKYIDRFDCIILPFNALEKAINVKK